LQFSHFISQSEDDIVAKLMLFAEGSEFMDMCECLYDGGILREVECLVDDCY